MVCGDSHPEGLKTGFGNDRTPVDTSPGRAGERNVGKDGGKRENVIRNDGTRIVSTSPILEEGGASLTLQGGDEATAITSVQSSAVGIEGGKDQDKIINTGTVTATARAEAPRIQVELYLTDTSHGDTSTYIRSRATGVSGGNGKDEIVNTGTIAVQTTGASGSGAVEPSAVSIGIRWRSRHCSATPSTRNTWRSAGSATSAVPTIAYDTLKKVPGVKVNRTNGAFYMAVAFEEGRLNSRQALPIKNREVNELVQGLVHLPGCSLDKRFVYYLLASTGICTVPLSSFCTTEQGFRITLLERDEKEFTKIFQTIAANVTAYLNS